MKPMAFTFAALALVLAAVTPVSAAELAGAKAFVVQLYSHYGKQTNPVFDPTGADAKTVFEPSMVALFGENARLTPKGDVGAIDGDPICDCQDDGGMRSRIVAARMVAAGHRDGRGRVDLYRGVSAIGSTVDADPGDPSWPVAPLRHPLSGNAQLPRLSDQGQSRGAAGAVTSAEIIEPQGI